MSAACICSERAPSCDWSTASRELSLGRLARRSRLGSRFSIASALGAEHFVWLESIVASRLNSVSSALPVRPLVCQSPRFFLDRASSVPRRDTFTCWHGTHVSCVFFRASFAFCSRPRVHHTCPGSRARARDVSSPFALVWVGACYCRFCWCAVLPRFGISGHHFLVDALRNASAAALHRTSRRTRTKRAGHARLVIAIASCRTARGKAKSRREDSRRGAVLPLHRKCSPGCITAIGSGLLPLTANSRYLHCTSHTLPVLDLPRSVYTSARISPSDSICIFPSCLKKCIM